MCGVFLSELIGKPNSSSRSDNILIGEHFTVFLGYDVGNGVGSYLINQETINPAKHHCLIKVIFTLPFKATQFTEGYGHINFKQDRNKSSIIKS